MSQLVLAYIDPGSGSMILQIILGGLAAAAVFLRVFWHRLLVTLRIRKPSEPEPRSSARAVAAPELEHVETAREPTGKR
ncbi:MAG: hypothetical protein M3123_00175 [Actinomycetota bacterium]|nr:hypothetical protein [Actinomycetota bacterium]